MISIDIKNFFRRKKKSGGEWSLIHQRLFVLQLPAHKTNISEDLFASFSLYDSFRLRLICAYCGFCACLACIVVALHAYYLSLYETYATSTLLSIYLRQAPYKAQRHRCPTLVKTRPLFVSSAFWPNYRPLTRAPQTQCAACTRASNNAISLVSLQSTCNKNASRRARERV